MSSIKYRNITLHLDNIRDLFGEPELDLDSQNWMPTSGMDCISSKLKPSNLRERVRLTVVLPEHKVGPGLAEKMRTMIRRYSQHQIDAARNELASLRWLGLKALQSGLIFLAICLSLSALADGAEFLPETLRGLLAEGFLIAGWVSMWHPAELLLYAWWPHWRQIRLYEYIMGMEVAIELEVMEEAAYAQ